MRTFTAIILTGLLVFGLACSDDPVSSTTITGSHSLITVSRDLANFNAIKNRLDADITLRVGPEQEVKMTVDDNIADYIVFSVTSAGELVIRTKPGIELSNYDLTIDISMQSLTAIRQFGIGEITNDVALNLTDLEIIMSGEGTISLNLEAENISTTINGDGDIILNGHAESHTCNQTGTGNLHAFDLETQKTDINLAGSGYAEVYAVENLSVDFENACCLYYKGNPEIDQSGSVSGNIVNSNP